jgi:hypothetical protein
MDTMSQVLMVNARKKLSVIWFSIGGILFLILFIQTMTNPGLYKDISEAWSWFLPNVVPTLSLMIGVFIAEAMSTGELTQSVNSFIYRLSLVLSIVYLLAIAIVILYIPVSGQNPHELMKNSNLALGPLQGIVSGVLVLFFTKKG